MANPTQNAYLAQLEGFDPNPNSRVLAEWRRVAKYQGLGRKHPDYRTERNQYLLAEFDVHFRHLAQKDTIQGVRDVLNHIGVTNLPSSMKQCKKIHVNLIDLVDSKRGHGHPRIFHTFAELREYTSRTNKFFPLNDAKDDPILKVFLRKFRGTRGHVAQAGA